MNFKVENGCFGYTGGKKVLSDINFEVNQKEILSILGSNGVGKTTLLKCTLGLLNWNSGRTLIDGKNRKDMKQSDVWSLIGYVPQAKLSAFAYTTEEMVLPKILTVMLLVKQHNRPVIHRQRISRRLTET